MEHNLISQKTFRYFTFGEKSKAKYLIYVLHGYSQLAEYFIRHFQHLNSDFYIVAPEGMHRFYIEGTSGRVGASWMTKEAREQDIKDTIKWLDKLDDEINCEKKFDKKIILGFSQGGATAARWSFLGKINPYSIIYWASVFPPDLIPEKLSKSESNVPDYFILGNNDEFFTKESYQKTIKFYIERK